MLGRPNQCYDDFNKAGEMVFVGSSVSPNKEVKLLRSQLK